MNWIRNFLAAKTFQVASVMCYLTKSRLPEVSRKGSSLAHSCHDQWLFGEQQLVCSMFTKGTKMGGKTNVGRYKWHDSKRLKEPAPTLWVTHIPDLVVHQPKRCSWSNLPVCGHKLRRYRSSKHAQHLGMIKICGSLGQVRAYFHATNIWAAYAEHISVGLLCAGSPRS